MNSNLIGVQVRPAPPVLTSIGADIVDYDFGFTDKPFSMIYSIHSGDWKHDHLWFKELVYEFFMNSDIKIDMVVTEENGSDTYSAEYKIGVDKF